MADSFPSDKPARFLASAQPDEFAACQRLAEALLPPHRLRALWAASGGSPLAVLALPPDILRGPDVALTDKQAARFADAIRMPLPSAVIETAAMLGVCVVWSADPTYPTALTPLSDSPAMLFVRGELLPDDSRAIAIVGSRRATGYGRGQADRFARAFAEQGIAVVSGGAAGIDTAAHRAVINAGGRTLAILGCGVDVNYPAENRLLFEQIVERGGTVLSEFAMGAKPEPWRFPTRNRIIAGISRVTLVIESPDGSGALLTATDAARYGRDVWVVPGPVDNGRSRGCHRLIQEGAGLADTPEDVLAALGEGLPEVPTAPPLPVRTPRPKVAVPSVVATAPPRPLPPLSPDEAALFAHIASEPLHLDVASQRAALSAPQATVAATLLEMKSLIKRLPGSLYIRA